MTRPLNILVIALFLFASCETDNSKEGSLDNEGSQQKESSIVDDRNTWEDPFELNNLWRENLVGKRIMEIGSNDGYWTYKLAQVGVHVVAADFSQARLDALMEGATKLGLENMIETRLISQDDPGLLPAEMDQVWAVNMFSVLPDRIGFFAKVHAGLKSDGQLILVDWVGRQTEHGPPVSERIAAMQAMDDMEITGFTDVAIRTSLLKEQWVMVAQNVPLEAYGEEETP